jgi:hypothetical protein
VNDAGVLARALWRKSNRRDAVPLISGIGRSGERLTYSKCRTRYELPMSTPVAKTKMPPNATCMAAETVGVSM